MLERVFNFIDERHVVRRVAFFLVLGLTTKTLLWTLDFASTSPRPGVDIAAIIAAVWAPLTALQAAIIALYNQGRDR